jgi:hypothetical protein
MTLPKPKHCGQNWLDMIPCQGGRTCGQCQKTIVDFSRMSWTEIEAFQNKNNNSVCGMYNPKQLIYWGQEIPRSHSNLQKIAAIAGLTVSLSVSAYSQSSEINQGFVLKGNVTDSLTHQPIMFANVMLKQSKAFAETDFDGNFSFTLSNNTNSPMSDTLVVSSVGYTRKHIIIEDIKEINMTDSTLLPNEKFVDVRLTHGRTMTGHIITYGVRKPSLVQRIKWTFKRWFGKKQKEPTIGPSAPRPM